MMTHTKMVLPKMLNRIPHLLLESANLHRSSISSAAVVEAEREVVVGAEGGEEVGSAVEAVDVAEVVIPVVNTRLSIVIGATAGRLCLVQSRRPQPRLLVPLANMAAILRRPRSSRASTSTQAGKLRLRVLSHLRAFNRSSRSLTSTHVSLASIWISYLANPVVGSTAPVMVRMASMADSITRAGLVNGRRMGLSPRAIVVEDTVKAENMYHNNVKSQLLAPGISLLIEFAYVNGSGCAHPSFNIKSCRVAPSASSLSQKTPTSVSSRSSSLLSRSCTLAVL